PGLHRSDVVLGDGCFDHHRIGIGGLAESLAAPNESPTLLVEPRGYDHAGYRRANLGLLELRLIERDFSFGLTQLNALDLSCRRLSVAKGRRPGTARAPQRWRPALRVLPWASRGKRASFRPAVRARRSAAPGDRVERCEWRRSPVRRISSEARGAKPTGSGAS